MKSQALVVPIAVLAAACAANVPIGTYNGDASAEAGGDAGMPDVNSRDVAFASDGAPLVPGCQDGSTDILIMGFDLTKPVLYRFDTVTLTFQPMPAPTGCPSGSGFSGKNPWAAALDRDATLWVHYLEWDNGLQKFTYDDVWTVDTATGSCTDTGKSLTVSGNEYIQYGLAFLPDPNDPQKDDLYASAVTPTLQSPQLHTLAMPSLVPSLVGPLANTAHSFLTATGDGRLFTLYQAGSPPWGIRQLDPKTGSSLFDQPVTGLTSSQGPFVFWGGSLWAFWNKVYSPQSLVTDVYKIDMNTWTATVVASGNFVVTAAAISSCAPIVPPK